MTRTSRFPLHMMAPHNTPRHSRESDHIGLWGKKLPEGPTRHYVTRTLFWLVTKHVQQTYFSFFNNPYYLSLFHKRFLFTFQNSFLFLDP